MEFTSLGSRFYGQVDRVRKLWPNSWRQAKDCLLRYN